MTRKALGILIVLVSIPSTAALAQGLSWLGGVDTYDIFNTTTGSEEWLAAEAADPSPRPVVAQRFVEFRGNLHRDLFDPARAQPFEFNMVFMDGLEHRVMIQSIEEVTRGSDTMRVVKGQVRGDELSRISLVLTDTQILGTVRVADHVIELRPVGNTISVIQRVDPSRFPKEQEPKPAHRQAGFVKKDPLDIALLVTAGGSFTGPEPFENAEYGDDAYVAPEIGVLVVWSSDHFSCDSTVLNGRSLIIQTDLDTAFAGYATSRVDVECVALSETWSSMNEALEAVRLDTTIATRRAALAADLVVMLVQDGYDSCGYTEYPYYPLYPIDDYVDQYAHDAAFAIVEEGCTLVQASLQHEIGHLLGMKHERFNELGGVNDFCGYGYPVMTGKTPVALSVMAYDDYCDYMGETCTRTPYYSIPRKPSTGAFAWLKNALHKCFGRTRGITCASTTPGHLNRPANNTMQIIDAARFVATYSDEL